MASTSRSYQQFCPVARSLDLFGDRWALLVIRQLLTDPLRFSDLQRELTGISPTVLRDRLRDLEEAGIVARAELPPPAARTVYELTERGRRLEPVIYEIARWGLPLLDLPTEEQPMLPSLLRPGLKALARVEDVPDRALTVGFDLDEGTFTVEVAPRAGDGDDPPRRDVERLTARHRTEGEPLDVVVRSSMPVLLWVRRGDLAYDDARGQGLLELAGDPTSVAAVERLYGLTPT